MAAIVEGPRSCSGGRDSEGHRTYKVTFLVRINYGEHVAAVLACPGLPTLGSAWQLDSDTDDWAWFRADADVKPAPGYKDEPLRYYEITMTASTKPQDPDKARCQDHEITDPLLEPPKIEGGLTKYQEEATLDRFGYLITNSAHEQIRGHQNEWDGNRNTVQITMNVGTLNLSLLNSMKDTVNDRPLWGLPPRCIKLSNYTWKRAFYGQCSVYYTWTLHFDTRTDTFDRDIMDEGKKVLNGHWGSDGNYKVDLINGLPPDPENPSHFIRAKDPHGENITMPLNGHGLPAGVTVDPSPASVVAATVIVDDLFIAGGAITQPPSPTKLSVFIVDDDNSISQGQIQLIGVDENNISILEYIDISDAGTMEYITDRTFKSLTSVLCGGPTPPGYSIIGAGAADTVRITTASRKTDQGVRHIEKYNESNFLVLGIPVTF